MGKKKAEVQQEPPAPRATVARYGGTKAALLAVGMDFLQPAEKLCLAAWDIAVLLADAKPEDLADLQVRAHALTVLGDIGRAFGKG